MCDIELCPRCKLRFPLEGLAMYRAAKDYVCNDIELELEDDWLEIQDFGPGFALAPDREVEQVASEMLLINSKSRNVFT